MYAGYRIVALIPLSDRHSAQDVIPFLAREAPVLDQCILLTPPLEPYLTASLLSLTCAYDLFTVDELQGEARANVSTLIYSYIKHHCHDSQTLYVLLPPDTCFLSPSFCERLAACKLSNPDTGFIHPGVIGDHRVTYLHQVMGLLPSTLTDFWHETYLEDFRVLDAWIESIHDHFLSHLQSGAWHHHCFPVFYSPRHDPRPTDTFCWLGLETKEFHAYSTLQTLTAQYSPGGALCGETFLAALPIADAKRRARYQEHGLLAQPVPQIKPPTHSTAAILHPKIAISSHVSLAERTLPPLLRSLIEGNHIPREDILAVIGGATTDDTRREDGVLHRYVTHNSYDHTALIDILEQDHVGEWWFLLHDTCTVGPRFYRTALKANLAFDHAALMDTGWLNTGLFSRAFLESIRSYVLSLKNLNKMRAILSEKIYNRLGSSTFYDTHKGLLFQGFHNMYGDGIFRALLYFPQIDVYKYQRYYGRSEIAHWEEAHHLPTPAGVSQTFETMYLDCLQSTETTVRHGEPGYRGKVGYGDFRISIRGEYFAHAISAHAPSRLTYTLNGAWQQLSVGCALNDTAPPGALADFLVYVDGVLVGVAPAIRSGDPTRTLIVNLDGARRLDLVADTPQWGGAHTIWIDPVLHLEAETKLQGVMGDLEMPLSVRTGAVGTCIATVLSPAYVDYFETMMDSLYLNGECRDSQVVVFGFQVDDRCRALCERYRARLIECEGDESNQIILKSAVYSIARHVVAHRYLLLDADMLIYGSLKPILEMISALPDDKIVIVRDYGTPTDMTLGDVLACPSYPYYSDPEAITLLNVRPSDACYSHIINGGVFAGSRRALLALDNQLRSLMPASHAWLHIAPDRSWREQAVFNLALARMDDVVLLDTAYNVQLDYAIVQKSCTGVLTCDRQPVRVLHFNASKGKAFYPEFAAKQITPVKAKFLSPETPLDTFFAAMTAFHSTYGLSDEWPAEPDTFYVAILDSLKDIQGDILVLGSSEGVLAAFLTSQPAFRVLLLEDVHYAPSERAAWAFLPSDSRERIRVRRTDTLIALRHWLQEHPAPQAVCTDTRLPIRHTFTACELALSQIASSGCLLIVDSHNPDCPMDKLRFRLEGAGWSVTANPNAGDLYTISTSIKQR